MSSAGKTSALKFTDTEMTFLAFETYTLAWLFLILSLLFGLASLVLICLQKLKPGRK